MNDTSSDHRNLLGGRPERLTVLYTSKPGLAWLSIKNFLLGVITLGIYRFWAKTHVRRHIWACISINGEPLEYTGTGKELFLGFLVIFAIIVLPVTVIFGVLSVMFSPEHPVVVVAQLVFFTGALMLYGMAIYRARRYRLSRTLWRGIRGSLTGSSMSFSALYFGAMLLRFMTLGWSTPAMNMNIQQRLTRDMTFGDQRFDFDGRAGPLYSVYALCWFLTPVVILVAVLLGALVVAAGLGVSIFDLGDAFGESSGEQTTTESVVLVATTIGGIVLVIAAYGALWSLYTARELTLFASYTTLNPLKFTFDATAGSLIGLWLGNLLILILTIGIGQPFIVQRTVRYLVDRLTVHGEIDIDSVVQASATLDRRGEGLLDVFDLDGF